MVDALDASDFVRAMTRSLTESHIGAPFETGRSAPKLLVPVDEYLGVHHYLENIGVWDSYRNTQMHLGNMRGRHLVVRDCDEHWIKDILLRMSRKQNVNIRSRMVFSLVPWMMIAHIVVHNYARGQ